MSYSAIDAAMRATRLSSSEKFVLVALAWHLNDQSGACYPSLTSLVAETGFSKNTVRTALDRLEKAGYLVRKKSFSKNGRVSKTDYTLSFPNPLTVVSNVDISTTDISTTDISTADTGCINHCTTLYQPLNHVVSTIDTEQGREQRREQGISDAAAEAPACTHQSSLSRRKPKSLADSCPVEKIVELYRQVCVPPCHDLRILSNQRCSYVKARWREAVKREHLETEEAALEYFRSYFEGVAASTFLTGRTGKPNPFVADFEWLMRPDNFAKVIEGRYADRKAAPKNESPIDQYGNWHEPDFDSFDYSMTMDEGLAAAHATKRGSF